jgi:hypothetical protein
MKDTMHYINAETVTLKLSRADVCRLCIACIALADSLDREGKHEDAKHWRERRDRIAQQRDEHDKKAEAKGWR